MGSVELEAEVLVESRPLVSAHESAEVLARSIEADVKVFVARELHDQVVQTLTTILLDMELLKRRQTGITDVQEEISTLQHSVRTALNQLRAVLYDLRDQPVEDTAFVDSVRSGLIAVVEERTGIQASLSVSPLWPARLSPRVALNLYRTIQEALNNVMNHSAARSVRVDLDVTPDTRAVVTVEDDGLGIGRDTHSGTAGLGVLGMRERAVLLGGELSIRSEPGRGTQLRLVVPMEGLA